MWGRGEVGEWVTGRLTLFSFQRCSRVKQERRIHARVQFDGEAYDFWKKEDGWPKKIDFEFLEQGC